MPALVPSPPDPPSPTSQPEIRTACLRCWKLLTDEEHEHHSCPNNGPAAEVSR